MRTNDMIDDKKLNQFKHRYYILRLKDISIITFQVLGIIVCAYYVLEPFIRWETQDFPVELGKYTIYFNSDYLNVMCFMISVFLLLSRPKDIRVRITDLRLAIKYMSKTRNLNTYEKMIISLAETYTQEVDIAYGKKKSGHADKIEPHEKRMVVRRWMIVWSIPLISILSAILVFAYNRNIPQVAAIDLLLGYALVMFEAYYYQILLKKAGISVMTDKYKSIVADKDDSEEYFKLYQKICYMKADRLSNYCTVLGIASAVMNLISILITILQESGKADFQELFALDIGNINSVIAAILMVASILFYISDFIVQHFVEPSIRELTINSKVPYSEENYEQLHREYNEKFGPGTLFSRKTLDWARAMYDYNNDAMVRKYFRKENVFVPIKCMFTVESAYPGRVPRYKLTALVTWLCGFLAFVWAEKNLWNIIPITIFSVFLYDVLILFNIAKLWNVEHKWLRYERNIEKQYGCKITWDVKWDIIEYLLMHSGIIIILFAFLTIFRGDLRGIITLIAAVLLLAILGFIVNEKKINLKGTWILKSYHTIGLMGMGIVICAFQYVHSGTISKLCNIAVMIGMIAVLAEIIAGYYRRVCNATNSIEFPSSIAVLLIIWSGIVTWICHSIIMYNNCVYIVAWWIYIAIASISFCEMIYGIIQNWNKKDALF